MATVGKKFTSPEKWEQVWFSKLSPGQKLLYGYIWDRCDHSGVLEFIPNVWSAHTGQTINDEHLEKLIVQINQTEEKILWIGDKVWLPDYISYQQQKKKSTPVKAGHPMLPKIVVLLFDHGLFEEHRERYPYLLNDYLKENSDFEPLKASTSLIQGCEVPLSSSKSDSESHSSSGSPPPFKGEKKESLTKVAERCLRDWPQPSDKNFFAETNTLIDKLKEMKKNGLSLEDSEQMLTAYLRGEKIRLKDTDDEQNLFDIINKFNPDSPNPF